MKKLLLLFFLFLNYCFVFAQIKKVSLDDSIPYHFSLKHDWALKINALQPFLYGEFRFGLEKNICKNRSIEMIGSFYVPSLQQFYDPNNSGGYSGQYSGRSNYKLGFGYLYKIGPLSPIFTQVSLFYHHFEDSEYNIEDIRNPLIFEGKSNYDVLNKHNVYCIQMIGGKRWELKHLFFDAYFGFSLREKFQKTIVTPYSFNYTEYVYSNKIEHYAYSGSYFTPAIDLTIVPLIQIGLNVGIRQ
jgi:hypothetical protein